MPYMNATLVLPPDLVAAIQNYVEGQLIYVPRRQKARRGWGTRSGGRAMLCQRNAQIRSAHGLGCPPGILAERFHLSEDSIRKIVAGGQDRL
jgi:hypothetical protein